MKNNVNLMLFTLLLTSITPAALAEDWPEWRGEGRTGVWKETGIIDEFPESGLVYKWRVPIGGGYAGPSVADGRVFVIDFVAEKALEGHEHVHCLDEETGKILWSREWPTNYGGLSYNCGPRATPTVDNERVYTQGAMGRLVCHKVETGETIWTVDYKKDLGAEVAIWGMAAAPIVYGDLLITVAAAEPDGKVVAFNKMTGEEKWRSISSNWGPGYVQPIITNAGGADQLIIWHPKAIASLNPTTGEHYWDIPWEIRNDAPIAQPVRYEDKLFLTAFYDGPMMLRLDDAEPAAEIIWKGSSSSEIKTDGLHACHITPFLEDGHIYGVCSYGQFRCLEIESGERVWESFGPTMENVRWASAFIVKNGDRFILNNDRGDLIIANLSPEGYEEIDRTKLIEPTTTGAGRRELKLVNWSHPAYANGHIFARNDEEIVRASLKKEDYK